MTETRQGDILFSLKGVSGGYGGKEVIQDLTLDIHRGDFAALIGPNGAGKSTLLKLMTGILIPSKGEVTFKDKAIQGYSPREFARQAAVVEQSMRTLPSYTVGEFVELGLFPHRQLFSFAESPEASRVAEALEECRIAHLVHRSIDQISGGELQLASIARALVQNRDVLLLDEPVSHLDIHHSIAVMDLLHDLNARGATVITVLHDMNRASDYCGRLIGLKEGTLFFDGTPEETVSYGRIEELFELVCIVRDNPITGAPFTYPVPGYVAQGKKKGTP